MTTVTVACKTATGFLLRLQREQVVTTNHGTTQSKEVLNVPIIGEGAETYIVKGFSRPAAKVAMAAIVGAGEALDGGTLGGYALTPGIPKAFWEKWLAQNKDLDAVKKRFLFAADKIDPIEGEAKDRLTENSGLEPVNPTSLPAEFRRRNASIQPA